MSAQTASVRAGFANTTSTREPRRTNTSADSSSSSSASVNSLNASSTASLSSWKVTSRGSTWIGTVMPSAIDWSEV